MAAPADHKPTDAEGVRRLRNRDPETFREFLRSESNRMYSIAYRLVKRREDIEDVVQEIFLEIWKSLPSYHGNATLKTWSHRIALNTCIAHHRKQRGAVVSLEDMDVESMASSDDVEESLLQKDLCHNVQAALDSLPADYRQAIVLHEMEGLTHREMADALGIPVGTAKSRLFYALSKLRQKLEPYILSTETNPVPMPRVGN